MSLIKNPNEVWSDPFSGINSLLKDYLNYGLASRINTSSSSSWRNRFRVDTFTDENSYYVVAELPGVSKGNIAIDLHNSVLRIAAKRVLGEGESASEVEANREVTVGDDVDASKVTAKYENGLLTVTLPRAEERKPKTISVS